MYTYVLFTIQMGLYTKVSIESTGTYRSDLSKAEETISSLYEQLSNEKLKTETSTDQLIKLQVFF